MLIYMVDDVRIPGEVAAVLRYYVYALRDPRNGRVFYIGKGIGDRINSHVREADKNPESERAKLKTITEVEGAGHRVDLLFLRTGIDDEHTAFIVEQAVIDAFAADGHQLTNLVRGHDSGSEGLATLPAVVARHQAAPCPAIPLPLVMVKIQKGGAQTIGGTPVASFVVVSSTTITTVTGASAAGAFAVTVTTPSGTSAISADAHFTYVAAPTVTAITPTHGTAKGGSSVTITGTGFTGASAVNFGAKDATYTVNSDSQITAVTPASSAGAVDVTVTTIGGVSSPTAADRFTFDPVTPVLGLTGVDTTTPLSIAVGLLLAGLVLGALAFVERRRRAAQ